MGYITPRLKNENWVIVAWSNKAVQSYRRKRTKNKIDRTANRRLVDAKERREQINTKSKDQKSDDLAFPDPNSQAHIREPKDIQNNASAKNTDEEDNGNSPRSRSNDVSELGVSNRTEVVELKKDKEMATTSNLEESADILKLARIAEIIELMEETNKSKDWLMDQIKQKREKIPAKPGLSLVAILKMCSSEFLENILGYLQNREFDIDVVIPPITRNYHWFFTDIVAASDPTKTTMDQARKIILLNKLIEMTDVFKQRDPETTLILPTGDGMAMGFDDSPEKPLLLALEVHKGLERYNRTRKKEDRVELRIGLDSGPVYIIKDLNGNENVWGPGIIMARRVMDLADKMNILASARFANDVKMLKPEYKQILHPIGDYQIKHGDKILIYNIYTDTLGNKKPPAADKKQKSKAEEEVRKTSNRFLFNRIAIDLDVRDPKTWLTHHTMAWNLVNISNEPIERVFYYLDGDVARSFQDMNVTIKDEDDRELEIMSLNVNKPTHKEFFVRCRKPLKPGEKGRSVTIEYDWEEPERNFFYRFASDCKKFEFSLTLPKGVEANQKVVKVDTETGDKTYAPVPAMVKYLPDKTYITWSASDLRAYEAYRFDW